MKPFILICFASALFASCSHPIAYYPLISKERPSGLLPIDASAKNSVTAESCDKYMSFGPPQDETFLSVRAVADLKRKVPTVNGLQNVELEKSTYTYFLVGESCHRLRGEPVRLLALEGKMPMARTGSAVSGNIAATGVKTVELRYVYEPCPGHDKGQRLGFRGTAFELMIGEPIIDFKTDVARVIAYNASADIMARGKPPTSRALFEEWKKETIDKGLNYQVFFLLTKSGETKMRQAMVSNGDSRVGVIINGELLYDTDIPSWERLENHLNREAAIKTSRRIALSHFFVGKAEAEALADRINAIIPPSVYDPMRGL